MAHLTFNGQRLNSPLGVIEYFQPFELLISEFSGTQTSLTFQLPLNKSMVINWGDGNTETINGLGESNIVATSNYSTNGSYVVTILKDYLDLTKIGCHDIDVSGDISSWSDLTNLTNLYCYNTDLSGDISSWSDLTNLTYLNCASTSVSGDISSWSSLTNLTYLSCTSTLVDGDVSSWSSLTNLNSLYGGDTDITGDISTYSSLVNLTYFNFHSTLVDFDSSDDWTGHNHPIYLYDCSMTSTQVDNMLIAFDGGDFVSRTINLGGNNANRTSNSDDAYNSLDSVNSLTVNI